MKLIVELLLAAMLVALIAHPVGAASACAGLPVPSENEYWKNGDVNNPYPLCGLQITTAASDGLSLFLMDPRAGRVVQLQFAAGGTMNRIEPPSPVDPARPGDQPNGVLMLGPRAFYAVAIKSGDTIPTLFRADRIPTAMRGGWKALRQIAGPSDLGLSAVIMNSTIWMLRSDSVKGFNIDWQPVATANNEVLAPPGPTIKLSGPNGNRPAAGVTATRNAIYVFGGRLSPLDVVKIPLENGAPTKIISNGKMVYPREGATALVHGNTVYLVGGNVPGAPVIERTSIDRDGSLGTWERFPDPPPGADILTAVLARDYMWIFRADGSLQRTRIGDSAAGRARVEWTADTRPRVVTPGESFKVPIDWKYVGPRDFSGVTVTVLGSARDLKVKHSPPFVSLDRIDLSQLKLRSPSTSGQRLMLQVDIPPDRRRSAYLAIVQLKAGGVQLGPLLRFRYVVKRAF